MSGGRHDSRRRLHLASLAAGTGIEPRPAAWFHRRQQPVLHRLLRHAYDRVPLYRRLYDEAGFRPEAFRSLADLDRIPPLTKALLKLRTSDDASAARIRDEMQTRLPPDVCVMVDPTASIPLESNGKRRLIIPFGR